MRQELSAQAVAALSELELHLGDKPFDSGPHRGLDPIRWTDQLCRMSVGAIFMVHDHSPYLRKHQQDRPCVPCADTEAG